MNPTASRVLLSCSFGHPKHSKTWSGTPRNLLQGLEALGVAVDAINSDGTRLEKALVLARHRAAGLGPDYRRGRGYRVSCADRVERAGIKLGVEQVLHLGSLDLPLTGSRSRLKHYLFCDATWNLWRRHAADAAAMSEHMLQLGENLEREAYARVEHIFSVSAYVRDDLVSHYRVPAERVTIVGTGRGQIQPYHGPKRYGEGPILFVGRGRLADKGCPLLVDAFRIAVAHRPDLRLVLVGPEELKPLARQLPNVTVAVRLPWPELETLFQQASLFAQPAPNEPWGLVYLEALACRTPVLGLNRNALPEITRNGEFGFLVDEPSPEAVADRILEAYADPARLEAMGRSGQDYCLRQFSWNTATARIAEVLFPSRASAVAPIPVRHDRGRASEPVPSGRPA
jgi:glycosyltransferase involved in cell wall biosynthesis